MSFQIVYVFSMFRRTKNFRLSRPRPQPPRSCWALRHPGQHHAEHRGHALRGARHHEDLALRMHGSMGLEPFKVAELEGMLMACGDGRNFTRVTVLTGHAGEVLRPWDGHPCPRACLVAIAACRGLILPRIDRHAVTSDCSHATAC